MNTGVPPAPFAFAAGTRASNRARTTTGATNRDPPTAGAYAPPDAGGPKSPPAVGWTASEPATTSGTNSLASPGKPEYLTMKRCPVSALKFAGADSGSNPSAIASVMRVVAKAVFARIRFVKLIVLGSRDPICAQTIL